MSKVSILIPSRGETYEVAPGVTVLQRMVQDIYEKATGEFEVLFAFDGPPYQCLPDYPNLTRLELPYAGLKPAVNEAARLATGNYLLKLDSHCMVSLGIDEALQVGMEDNWMVVPRFYTLDAENWRWQDERFCDYWMLDCPLTDPKGYRFKAGGYWRERTQARLDITPLDETLTHHGSAWFVPRDFFLNCLGGMSSEGYGNMFMEPAELGLKTWLGPWYGKVMVNKACWYAHMHKGGTRPRGYGISMTEVRRSYEWTAKYWMENQWEQRVHDLGWLIDKFWPIPTWPEDWREREAARREVEV